MGKLGGDRTIKREIAPTFYVASRKKYTFITKPSPGAHPAAESYTPITLFRDVLNIGYSSREIKRAIKDGRLIVDGRVRKDTAFSIGLMDVVEIRGSSSAYRMVPFKGRLLYPFIIDGDDKALKLVRIDGKHLIRNGRVQIRTNDGRTMVVDEPQKYAVGDTLLIRVPSQEIVQMFKLGAGALALVIRGSHLGRQIIVKGVQAGKVTRQPMIIADIEDKVVTLPRDYVMVIGNDRPAIKLPLVE